MVLATTVAGLAVFDVARVRVVGEGAGLAANLALGVALVLASVAAHLGADELGTERRRAASGLRWGGLAAAVVTVVVVAGAAAGRGSAALADDRLAIGTAGMLGRVLVVIPVGTVLVEELAFRGVLLGLLRRLTTTGRAAVTGSVLFGLWHVPSALASIDSSAALGAAAATATGTAIAVTGTVVATTVAGLAFTWLRLRSGSLLSPVLAHVATNSVTFGVAWLLVR